MKFSTIYEHSGKIITALIVILILAAIGCGNLYLNNQLLSSRLVLKSQAARKDSIEAVRKDIAFKNVVHPESVVVDKEKGMVYFAVRNDKLSDNPLPVIESTIPDTISLSASVKTTYRTVTDTSDWVKTTTSHMQCIVDSLTGRIDVLDKMLSLARDEADKRRRNDSLLAIKPFPNMMTSSYVLGGKQNDFTRAPDWALYLRFNQNYSLSREVGSFGGGFSLNKGIAGIDGLIYKDWIGRNRTSQPRVVVKGHIDALRIVKIKSKK